LLGLGGVAQAAPDEAEPKPPAEWEIRPLTKAEPQPASPITGSEEPVTLSPHLEAMGRETFPGHLRVLYGGSLWLERSFRGLHWP
jgi:hypothetical protein